MDRLNNLEKSLPPERPANDQIIASLNQQVTQEFKIAANAVTNLYRLSSERSSLNRHAGYAECLDDVIRLIDRGFTAQELRTWCEHRKCEIRGENESTAAPGVLNASSGTRATSKPYASGKSVSHGQSRDEPLTKKPRT